MQTEVACWLNPTKCHLNTMEVVSGDWKHYKKGWPKDFVNQNRLKAEFNWTLQAGQWFVSDCHTTEVLVKTGATKMWLGALANGVQFYSPKQLLDWTRQMHVHDTIPPTPQKDPVNGGSVLMQGRITIKARPLHIFDRGTNCIGALRTDPWTLCEGCDWSRSSFHEWNELTSFTATCVLTDPQEFISCGTLDGLVWVHP